MYLVMSIWGLGFILCALAFYYKDLRGRYVSGTDLIIKFVICLIPSMNLVFGIAYFLVMAFVWCYDNFINKCGRLVWQKDHFEWISNKDTNDE